MLRKSILFLLVTISLMIHVTASEKQLKVYDVKPLTRYSLSFKAIESKAGNAKWELLIFDKDGLLPYEGVFGRKWQEIIPGKSIYTHKFYTPRDGSSLKFIIHYKNTLPEVSEIKLEEITGPNLVINGDFSLGLDNYSGWNDHFLSKLTKENGKIVLKSQKTGYTLTNLIPVEGGATYRYIKGSSIGRVFLYDCNLLRVGILPDYTHKQPLLIIPNDIRFIRIAYADSRPNRTPEIRKVGIELEKSSISKPEIKTYSPYNGEIILKPNSPLPVVRAAREIQHWVRKISKKEIMVLGETSSKDNFKIYVGKKWAKKLFPEDLKFLEGSDGFAVRQKDGSIYVFSDKPGGTLFGAIRLIEKNSDLIFARPRKEFGTIYSKNPNLTFKNADFIQRPAFDVRMSHAYRARTDDTSRWHGRMGLNTPAYFYNIFRRAEEGGCHVFESNYMGVINQSPKYSPEIVKKKYPKLYAMENGRRNFKHSFICPTHPKAVKALTSGFCAVAEKAKKEGIKLERLGVRVQDGWTVCSCDRCMKPIKLPNGKILKPKSDSSQRDPLFFSTRKAILMNKVAKEFAKIHPDINISVEAYVYASEPPAIPYDSSIIPMFCAYPTCSLRFPLLDPHNSPDWKRKFQGFLDWSKNNNARLSMFSYYYPCSFSAVSDSIAKDWQAMKQSGKGVHTVLMDAFNADNRKFKNLTDKAYGSWEYAAAEKWITTRLLWDPAQDPQKLREYYIERAYGKAAPEMMKFYNIIRKYWKDPSIKTSVSCHTNMRLLVDTFIIQTGQEKPLRALLVKAQKNVVNPNSRILIDRMLKAFDIMIANVNRINVPYIAKSTDEWNRTDSTFWLQALKLKNFKKVSTWKNHQKAPAENPTEVSVMRDKDRLYFRFKALKAKKHDKVELILEAKRHARRFYFSLNRDGKRHAMKTVRGLTCHKCPEWKSKVEKRKNSYIAMFSIPFSMIDGLDTTQKEFKIFAKFSRLVSGDKRKGYEESSLTGDAITKHHYMNYWTGLNIKQ